jgi:hypothetical protein
MNLSKPLDSAISNACFSAKASHSFTVTSKEKYMVWAWTSIPWSLRKQMPITNFPYVEKLTPSTLHFNQLTFGFSHLCTRGDDWVVSSMLHHHLQSLTRSIASLLVVTMEGCLCSQRQSFRVRHILHRIVTKRACEPASRSASIANIIEEKLPLWWIFCSSFCHRFTSFQLSTLL